MILPRFSLTFIKSAVANFFNLTFLTALGISAEFAGFPTTACLRRRCLGQLRVIGDLKDLHTDE